MMSLKPRMAAARPSKAPAPSMSRRIPLNRARVVVARAEAALFERLGGVCCDRSSFLGLVVCARVRVQPKRPANEGFCHPQRLAVGCDNRSSAAAPRARAVAPNRALLMRSMSRKGACDRSRRVRYNAAGAAGAPHLCCNTHAHTRAHMCVCTHMPTHTQHTCTHNTTHNTHTHTHTHTRTTHAKKRRAGHQRRRRPLLRQGARRRARQALL
jgi:hypothetical protein